MKLVDKHFKHGNKLHKIFNRKTLKISYSSTKNIFQIINSHNKNITKDFQDQINNRNNNNNCVKKECNCKSRDNCPMNGLCNLNNVIYQAIIYPKENIMDKKNLYQVDFHEMEGEVFKPQIYLLPRTPKTPYGTIETILMFEKQRVNP